MIARRGLLKTGLGVAGSLIGGPVALALARLPERRLVFNNLHTKEELDVVYWQNGDYLPDCLDAVNSILRDWRQDQEHVIEPKLLDLLTALNATLETDKPFAVVSGYRSAKTNALLQAHSSEVASGSYHLIGQAIDICIDGVDNEHIRAAATQLAVGG